MSAEEQTLRPAGDGEIEEWALVLASAGIPHRVERTAGGSSLVVAASDVGRADGALAAYARERSRPAETSTPFVEYGRTWAGLVLAQLLLVFYVVTGPAEGTVWSRTGSASAERILAGEVWRTVTALTLHADAAHLLGNAVACVVFVSAVLRLLGPGLGGWLVLVAGAGGNAINAFVHGARHSSVGFSTAIFGAIGILGGLQFARKRGEPRAWLAVAGALALLGVLGTSPRADLMAHLFGLLVGIALGLLVAVTVSRPPGPTVQWLLALGALATVAGAWMLALA